jgi:glycerophosphoryl diester phosphodiesterase
MSFSLFGDGVKFFNIAHRGFSAIAPENTISSFEKAIEAGANMLELDVMTTSDNQVVVFHDHRLGRTTDGKGLVKKKNLSEIKSLDAGSWFDGRYKGERVPLLDEVLEMAKGRVRLDIEMKPQRYGSVADFVDKCEKIIERHKMEDDVIFSSFNLQALRYLHHKAPHLRFAPLYRHNLNPTPRSFPLKYCAQGVVLNHMFLDQASVRQFHDLGIGVFIYTANGIRRIEKMIKMGVDGVISDNPAEVASVAKRILG